MVVGDALRKADDANRVRREDCPNRGQHTDGPSSYLLWHAWSSRMAKTHRQRKCPDCGLWLIWEPR